MGLDTRFGAGTLAALTTVINNAKPGGVVQESDQVDGSTHVEVSWGGGWPAGHVMRFDVTGVKGSASLHFSFLSYTCAPNPAKREASAATYQSLCNHLPQALRNVGIVAITTAPYDNASTAILLQYSKAADPTGGFIVQPNGD